MAETFQNLMLGFSVALQPSILVYAFVGCVIGTLVGMLPGARAARRHQPAAAGDVRAESDHRHRAARRRLLRRDVRRLDDLDPDAHSGRGRLGDDLRRRLRDDAERARRAGARHRGDRLVRRRHAGRGRADAARADARRVRAALRPAGVHRAAADGFLHPRLHERRLDAEDAGDGGVRPHARHDRHRRR